MVSIETDQIFANGIFAKTGLPLPLSTNLSKDLKASLRREDQSKSKLMGKRGLRVDLNPAELAEAGWGIVFPANNMKADEIEDALSPLIQWRASEAKDLFKIFKGKTGWRVGDTASAWLARQGSQGARMDVVNPKAGVPYYLMIVGSPEELPMSFQYSLDIFWGVGRLHFSTVEEYKRYAKDVVDYESAAKPPQTQKLAAVFATKHSRDRATEMFTERVAKPLVCGDDENDPLGWKQRFKVDRMLGREATKAGLTELLRGERTGGLPALLISGTHGMAFELGDSRQSACQGALVCQDWKQLGTIDESAWFSAADIPAEASLKGLVYFMFACYGGGWEKVDTFRTGLGGVANQIAPTASVSRLSQAMLAHPKGGALAIIAHVDRAWSYAFTTENGGTQATGMRNVLTAIMMGTRLGHAMDQFNVRWAAIATELSDAIRNKLPDAEIARMWIARDDARNYSIFGDPAVRLRVETMIDGI